MKRNLFLGVCLAAFIAPTGVKAQYPQLTSEASQTYAKMKEELYRRSDEAWAKALPVVQKEAREGRPYNHGLPARMICRRQKSPHSLELKEEVCLPLADVAER